MVKSKKLYLSAYEKKHWKSFDDLTNIDDDSISMDYG